MSSSQRVEIKGVPVKVELSPNPASVGGSVTGRVKMKDPAKGQESVTLTYHNARNVLSERRPGSVIVENGQISSHVFTLEPVGAGTVTVTASTSEGRAQGTLVVSASASGPPAQAAPDRGVPVKVLRVSQESLAPNATLILTVVLMNVVADAEGQDVKLMFAPAGRFYDEPHSLHIEQGKQVGYLKLTRNEVGQVTITGVTIGTPGRADVY